MKFIGNVLTPENVERAIQHAIEHQLSLHEGTKYSILYRGREFPPKAIADLAVELDEGLRLNKDDYYIHGAEDKLHPFYQEMGYLIIPKRQRRISRLCYNRLNWTEPTGPPGKSPGNHEGTFGYGHEEWLFDLSRIIDGYHYGFVEALRRRADSFQGQTFDVRFYTVNGDSGRRFWAGRVTALEVITPEVAEEVRQEYERQGWLEKMERQVVRVQERIEGLTERGWSNYHDLKLFNVRFRPEAFDPLSVGVLIPKNNPLMGWHRYSFYKEIPALLAGFPLGGDLVSRRMEVQPAPPAAGTPTSTFYTHSSDPVEMTFLHEEMSLGLTRILGRHYGSENVHREKPAGFNAREVDIEVKHEGETIYYELKTDLTVPMSIRAALGQLMEYSHWVTESRADHWVIVTQPQMDLSAAEEYILHLRNTYRLPVFLQTFDFKTDELTELLPRSTAAEIKEPRFFL